MDAAKEGKKGGEDNAQVSIFLPPTHIYNPHFWWFKKAKEKRGILLMGKGWGGVRF